MAMRGVETRIQEIRHRIFHRGCPYGVPYGVADRPPHRSTAVRHHAGRSGQYPQRYFSSSALSSANVCVWRWVCRAAVLPSTRRCPTTSRLPPARKPTTRRRSSTSSSSHATPARKMRSWLRTHVRAAWRIRALRYVPRAQYRSTASTAVLLSIREKCIKCGRCMDVCQYHAIIRQERPCAAACGMDAIHSDCNGRADIDYESAFPAASAL